MDPTRFDTLTRSLRRTPSRRTALRSTLGGIGIAAAGWLRAVPVRAAKKKARKKKCPTCPDCPALPPAPTCPQTCPSACDLCFVRPGASTLCGDIGIAACSHSCTSDADCAGEVGTPFCVSHTVTRATGEIFDICTGTPGAFCNRIPAC